MTDTYRIRNFTHPLKFPKVAADQLNNFGAEKLELLGVETKGTMETQPFGLFRETETMWEYKIFNLPPFFAQPSGLENHLNELAKDGWEYAGMAACGANQRAVAIYLKRMITDTTEQHNAQSDEEEDDPRPARRQKVTRAIAVKLATAAATDDTTG
jgi:hypothetical protein